MYRKIGKRRIELGIVNENTTEYLEVSVSHFDGLYHAFVRKIEKTNRFGYDAESYMLCADGNFHFRVKEGRFSKKQAEILRVNLSKLGMASVKELWSNKSYEPLVHYIKNTLLLENK